MPSRQSGARVEDVEGSDGEQVGVERARHRPGRQSSADAAAPSPSSAAMPSPTARP